MLPISILVDGVAPVDGVITLPGDRKITLSNINSDVGLQYQWTVLSTTAGKVKFDDPASRTPTLVDVYDQPIRKSGKISVQLAITTNIVSSILIVEGGMGYSTFDPGTTGLLTGGPSLLDVQVGTVDNVTMVPDPEATTDPEVPVMMATFSILSATIVTNGYDFSGFPVIRFDQTGTESGVGIGVLESITYTATTTIVVGARNYEFYSKRCADDPALDISIKEFQGSMQDSVYNLDYLLDTLDTSGMSDLKDAVASTDPIYSASGSCEAINCRYDVPSNPKLREEYLFRESGILVVDGRLLKAKGEALLPAAYLYELSSGSNSALLETYGLDTVRDVLSLEEGSFLMVFWILVADSTGCTTGYSRRAVQYVLWNKTTLSYSSYGSSATPKNITQLKSIYPTQNGEADNLFYTLFWVNGIDSSGGAYSALTALGLSSSQLMAAIVGSNQKGFVSGNLLTYTVKASSIDDLVKYGLNDTEISLLLERKVPGVDVSVSDMDMIQYANELIASSPANKRCGVSLENAINLLFDSVNMDSSFNSTAVEDLNYCLSLMKETDAALYSVLSAVSNALSLASASIQKVQDEVGSVARDIQGLESELWRLIDPDGGLSGNILNCLIGDFTFLPINAELIDGLLISIPGLHTAIKGVLLPIITLIDSLSTVVCASADITEQVLSLFGVSTNKYVKCLTLFGLTFNTADIIAKYPCLLASLQIIRSSLQFFLSMLKTVSFGLSSFMATLDALLSGVEIRFKKTVYCSDETPRVTTIINNLAGLLAPAPVAV